MKSKITVSAKGCPTVEATDDAIMRGRFAVKASELKLNGDWPEWLKLNLGSGFDHPCFLLEVNRDGAYYFDSGLGTGVIVLHD